MSHRAGLVNPFNVGLFAYMCIFMDIMFSLVLHVDEMLKTSFVFLSTGADLFSNCTEECKALGHSDRCWMPSFVHSDGPQGPDYHSNLHVPGMDSVPDTEVFESPEQMADKSFSNFYKETPLSQQSLHLYH